MFGRCACIVAAASLALQTHAVLIPSNVLPTNNDDDSASLLPQSLLPPTNQILRIPCHECAFARDEHGTTYVDDALRSHSASRQLLLRFSTSDDNRILNFNDQPIYPLSTWNDELSQRQRLYVSQVDSAASDEDLIAGRADAVPLWLTGSVVNLLVDEPLPGADMAAFARLHLSIYSIESQMMNLDDAVLIDLFKTADGAISIFDVKSTASASHTHAPLDSRPPPPPPSNFRHDSPPAKDCSLLPISLCRFRNFLEAKVMGFRPPRPSSRRPQHKRPCPPGNLIPEHEVEAQRPHSELEFSGPRGRPHHTKPHWAHHHGHRRLSWFGAFTRGFITVLIPVMVGITVGLTVSLIGLLVGRLASFLWIRIVRGTHPAVHMEDEYDDRDDVVEAAEKMMMFLTATDATEQREGLPRYEEAPAYELVAEKV